MRGVIIILPLLVVTGCGASVTPPSAAPATPSVVTASEARQETVPREVAEHLLHLSPYGGPGRILPGAMPDRVAAWFPLPDGARVIGSSVFPRSSSTVIAVPAPSVAAASTIRERLLATGWSPAAHTRDSGFLTTTGQNGALCGPGDQLLTLLPRNPRGAGEHTVMIVLMHPRGGPGCREAAPPATYAIRSLIPPLDAPPLALVTGGPVSGSTHDSSAGTAVISTLSPLELVRHYAGQLREQGWRPGEESASGAHAAQRWTIIDGEGATWFGFLSAWRIGEETRSAVRLHVTRYEEW